MAMTKKSEERNDVKPGTVWRAADSVTVVMGTGGTGFVRP